MSEIPLELQHSDKKSMNSKIIFVVAIVLLLIVIGGFTVNKISQKIISLTGEKYTEKMIENATGGKADVDVNSDSVTVKTTEGTFSTSTQLPTNWPKDVPVYPNSTVTYSGTTNPTDGSSGSSVMTTTNDSIQKVADYYSDKLTTEGWKIETTQNMTNLSILTAVKNDSNLTLSVTTSDNSTAITLVFTTK